MVTEALIAACIQEDPKAQYQMYRALYPMMMSVCSRYERNRQDAVARMNTGFLKILRNMATRKTEAPFEPWARRVMINTVIDEFRKEKQRKIHEVLPDPDDMEPDGTVNEYLKEMEAEAFEAMLQGLPPVSRHVFNLFAVDGYTHAEISKLLGIGIGTSKWHVSHARGILQNVIRRMAFQKATTR